MARAFRFDDEKPKTGTTVNAFRSLSGLKHFARMQGSRGSMKFWQIDGSIVSDDDSEDGIRIRVSRVKQVY